MKEYTFIFDLDSTITGEEILPLIAGKINARERMNKLTEKTMRGEIPYEISFAERVELLKKIPVREAAELVEKISLNEKIVEFITSNRNRCYVVTGNLDVWIEDLMKRIGMEGRYFCSETAVEEGYIVKVVSSLNKKKTVSRFKGPLVAIGDGSNDVEMIEYADVGIAYGGVREVAPFLAEKADIVINDENELCRVLEGYL